MLERLDIDADRLAGDLGLGPLLFARPARRRTALGGRSRRMGRARARRLASTGASTATSSTAVSRNARSRSSSETSPDAVAVPHLEGQRAGGRLGRLCGRARQRQIRYRRGSSRLCVRHRSGEDHLFKFADQIAVFACRFLLVLLQLVEQLLDAIDGGEKSASPPPR